MKPVPSASAAFGGLIVAMCSFQAGASIAKHLIPEIGAPGTTALRLGLSALLVGLFRRAWRTPPTRSQLPALLGYGLALGTMNFVFYLALRTIPLGIAVALEFAGPLAVALFSAGRRADLVWIALAAAGLVSLLPISTSGAALDPMGVAFALMAGVCWALYIVFGQKAGRAMGSAAATWGMIIAAIITVPIGVVDAGWALLTPSVLLMGLAIAIFSSALPYSLEMLALRRLSARVFGTLMSLEPAIAALTGMVVLHEALTLTQWLAIASVMAASAGMVSGGRQ